MRSTLCEHDTSLIARAALGELAEGERAALDARLAACPACQSRLDDYRALLGGMPRLFEVSDSPADSPAALPPKLLAERRLHVSGSTENDLSQPSTPAHTRARRPSALAGALVAALLIVALVGVYAVLGPGHSTSGTGKSTLPPTATHAAADCAGVPTPQPVTRGMANTIGHYPFEMGGFAGEIATLEAGGTPTPHGYYGKVVAQVDPGFPGTVTLTGKSLDTGAPLWFLNFTSDTPATSQTFQDLGPNGGYAGYILLPASGCYSLTATWDGGSWTVPFYGNVVP